MTLLQQHILLDQPEAKRLIVAFSRCAGDVLDHPVLRNLPVLLRTLDKMYQTGARPTRASLLDQLRQARGGMGFKARAVVGQLQEAANE